MSGLAERDAEAVVAAGATGGPYRDLGDLATRSGVPRRAREAGLGRRLRGSRRAAPSASDGAGAAIDRRRTCGGWASPAARRASGGGEQLALPLPLPEAPALREQTPWERVTADYAANGMSLDEHPLALMRPELDPATVTSADLLGSPTEPIVIAGMTVARQRPATANGVVFMLLEDESGMTNVVVLPPVYERHRLLVRTAGSSRSPASSSAARVSSTSSPSGSRSSSGPECRWPRSATSSRSARTGRDGPAGAEIADLDAVLPAAHSFGRRGR